MAIFFVASRIILFACFVTYYSFIGELSADKVFVSIAFFNTMRITVTLQLPQSIAATAEAIVTCKRIENFLLLDEIEPSNEEKCLSEEVKNDNLILMSVARDLIKNANIRKIKSSG